MVVSTRVCNVVPETGVRTQLETPPRGVLGVSVVIPHYYSDDLTDATTSVPKVKVGRPVQGAVDTPVAGDDLHFDSPGPPLTL